MGIQSREYFRASDRDSHGWGSDTPACKWLVVSCVALFVLQLLFTRADSFTSAVDDWLALRPDAVLEGQVWRLLTAAFLHSRATPWHLIMNMLGLWWFGTTLERMYGSREFAAFYLLAAVFSSVGYVLFGLFTARLNPMVGASGAVLALLMLYATHFPRERLYFFGILPVEVRWLVVFYVAVDLYPVLLEIGGTDVWSNVAHAAHLSGLLFGYLYRRWDGRLSTLFRDWSGFHVRRRLRTMSTNRKLKVYQPDDEPPVDLDAELDRILAKIHEHGTSSLTEREQALLTQASQRYKNRR